MESTFLENLLSNPIGLFELEKRISSFNVFEATGAVRRELRHSDFIGFLFDPSETHGLDETLFRIFCESFNINISQTPIVTVSREWEHIDIMVRDRANKVILVIENKIDTSEHSDQLQRYRRIVDAAYPDYARHYFFLTKTGEEPSDSHYKILSYADIRSFVERLASASGTGDVATILIHYANMIERHFMPDNEIAQLCRKIYTDHRRAIDLIIEHRPEGGEDVFDKLRELIDQRPDFELDHSDVHRIRFAVPAWDSLPDMKTSNWTPSKRFVLFEAKNNVDGTERVQLKLFLGPTPSRIREELFGHVQGAKEAFRHSRRELGEKWAQVYNIELLGSDDVQQDDKLKMLENNWNHFLRQDFPLIDQSIRAFIESQDSK